MVRRYDQEISSQKSSAQKDALEEERTRERQSKRASDDQTLSNASLVAVDAQLSPTRTTTMVSDVVNIEAAHLEIAGIPEDRVTLSDILYRLPFWKRAFIMAMFAVIAVVSPLVLSGIFSNPNTYAGITQTLDAKQANVLALTASATSASTAISLIPDDVGSAIADKLADLTVGFLIILVAIFLMKYLLTTIGFIFFTILVPLCCGLYIASLALGPYRVARHACALWATKLLLMGIAIFALVPTSVAISNMIDTTYEESINQTIVQAEEAGQKVDQAVKDEKNQSSSEQEGENAPLNWFSDRWRDVQNIAGDVANTVSSAFADVTSWFQGMLNNFIEATAVMLVTSCLIPILVLILFLFILKAIFNFDVSVPLRMLNPRTYRKTRAVGVSSKEQKDTRS